MTKRSLECATQDEVLDPRWAPEWATAQRRQIVAGWATAAKVESDDTSQEEVAGSAAKTEADDNCDEAAPKVKAPRCGDDCRMIGEAGDEGDLIIFPADQVTDDVDLINCKKLFPEMADAVCFWESCRKRGVDWRDASRYMFARRKHQISIEDVILEVHVGQCTCTENHRVIPVFPGERLRRCFECLKFLSQ